MAARLYSAIRELIKVDFASSQYKKKDTVKPEMSIQSLCQEIRQLNAMFSPLPTKFMNWMNTQTQHLAYYMFTAALNNQKLKKFDAQGLACFKLSVNLLKDELDQYAVFQELKARNEAKY